MDTKLRQEIFPVSTTFSPDGQIAIADCDLQKLAADFGTPLYLYDATTIKTNMRDLHQALQQTYPAASAVAYASKAYLSLAFARKLALEDLDLDVVSLGEMMLAKKAGIAADRVHFHGNNKSISELRTAIDWGVHAIVADNLEELEIISRLAAECGKIQNIWLRITPDIRVKTHPHIETSAQNSKFGLHIGSGQARQGIEYAMRSDSLNLIGLHTHLGSQLFDAEPYALALRMLLKLAAECHYTPQEISPGGGWGVRYSQDDPTNDVHNWITACAEAITGSCQEYNLPLPRLILEPGRFIVARSAVALYHIGTRKTTLNGKLIAAVDGGMADNPRYALYQAKYSALIAGKANLEANKPTSIVGKFCESGDTLIEEVMLPELARDDVLVIPVCGAFQLSMASNYNMAARPIALWLEDGNFELLQSQERPDENGWFI